MTRRTGRQLSQSDFERLLGFRDGLRRFLHWSEEQAKEAGLTGAQHQLLLAIRGHGDPPSIGEVADHLMLRHHSVVELVDRAVRSGLVERTADAADQRIVRLELTEQGQERLTSLAATHIEELSRLREQMEPLWDQLPSARS
jgi:DNA-binding MarR family transcriptional regulator